MSKITAADMRRAVASHFCQPECAVAFEVSNATGHGSRRHLDAVAMELWPSRGLALHGIEIKTARADFRKEVKTPAKAEEVARYCDFFWIAAPVGVVPHEELPMAWGLLELSDKEGAVLRRSIAATKTEAQPADRLFVAALLRAAGRDLHPDSHGAIIKQYEGELNARFVEKVEAGIKSRLRYGNQDGEKWRELCEALGHDPRDWLQQDGVIAAVKAVRLAGVTQTYNGLHGLATSLVKLNGDLDGALKLFGIEPPDPAAVLKSRIKRRHA